jgi:hypothetical protein
MFIKIIEWIKTKIIVILGIIITGLVLYIILGKGVVINKTYNNTSVSNATSNSMSYAGSMSIGFIGGQWQGSWIIKEKIIELPDISFKYSGEETMLQRSNVILTFLNSLDPIQYCYSKIVFTNHGYCFIYYPDINKVVNEKKGNTETKSQFETHKE